MLYKKLFSLLVMSTLLALGLSAQQRIFLQYDPACMDRLVYDVMRPEGASEFVTYHINLEAGKKLVLEVGPEIPTNAAMLPNGMLNCQTGGFDEAMMRRINANVDEVFVVLVQGGVVTALSPVQLAGLYTNANELITYESPKYGFRFQEESAVIGENIAFQNPGANVYFEGREDNACTGNYLFRQLKPQSAYPKVDFKLAPEIGIVSETIGASTTGSATQSMTLRTINNEPRASYLQRNCGMLPGEANPLVAAPASYSGGNARGPGNFATNAQGQGADPTPPGMLLPAGAQVSPAQSGYVARTPAPQAYDTPAAYNAAAASAVAAASTEIHTVERGETLFGISKEYGVTVGQVQEWNNLGSSTMIKRGQQLRVAPPNGSGLAARGGMTTTSQPLPAAYDGGQAAARQASPNDQTHIVKPGETVALVALRYGYTEDKFREINELGSQEIIRVGQRLKTTNCSCPEGGVQNQPASVRSPANGLIRPQAGNTMTSRSVVGGTNPGMPVAPSSYEAASARIPPAPAAYGTTPSTQPQRYGQPRTTPAEQPMYNPPTTISNDPDFGANAVIPQAYSTTPNRNEVAPPTFGSLESRRMIGGTSPNGTTATPGTPVEYGTYGNQRQAQKVHIVQEGESLFTIARMYNMSVEELQQRNAMSPGEIIIPYQRLYVK